MSAQASNALLSHAADLHPRDQVALYLHALKSGRRGQLWAGLTRRSQELLSLDGIPRPCAAAIQNCEGKRTVAIAQICGSENRSADFDRDFNPLQDHTRDRWLGIATARQRGRTLPPVALVQVGDRYFVRDGHHRISVARALGQKAIEATIEVWQVDATAAVPGRLWLSCMRPWAAQAWPRLGSHGG